MHQLCKFENSTDLFMNLFVHISTPSTQNSGPVPEREREGERERERSRSNELSATNKQTKKTI